MYSSTLLFRCGSVDAESGGEAGVFQAGPQKEPALIVEPRELVTFCVPVYNGAAFVAETLSSIRKQSYQGFRVVISVDASTDESAPICRSFLDENRFQVFEQERRLGWVGNCNWLLSHVTTPYFCIIPHDDVLDPSYVERLVAVAKAHPRAAVVYSDIRTFGSIGNRLITQNSIYGSVLTRVLAFLVEHYNAVAFRGLVRSETLNNAGPLQNNPFDDFAEDTIWLMKLVIQGDFVRVAEPLYAKRYHDASVHRDWSTWSRERSLLAWNHHCLELAVEAFKDGLTTNQRAIILHALVFRLLRSTPNLGPFENISELLNDERQTAISSFLTRLAEMVGENQLNPAQEQLRHLLTINS